MSTSKTAGVTKITPARTRPPRGPNSPALNDKLEQLTREMRLMSSFDALFSQAVAERVGMHSTDIETMDLLNTLGPMTAGELSNRTGLSSGATTRLIDRLERAGYVRRCTDEKDRRCVIIEPVHEKVHAHLYPLFQPLVEELTEFWSTFTDEELDVIIEFVRRNNAIVAEVNAGTRAQTSAAPAQPR